MGIQDIELLFPGDDYVPANQPLVVTSPVDDVFTISGPPAKLSVIDTAYFLDGPTVTDHGDGSFTVSSE